MASNSFGTLFRVCTFGESHGPGIGVVIDGCPAGLQLDFAKIADMLKRRRPGYSVIASRRQEADDFEVLSGLVNRVTTGAPLAFFVKNKDHRPGDYEDLETVFRPSHADFTYFEKYGIRDHRGGGRSSARETAVRVIGGAVALQLLEHTGIQMRAFVSAVGPLSMDRPPQLYAPEEVESNPVKCPDPQLAVQIEALINETRESGDSLGGIVTCVIDGAPAGLGAPVFDRLEADLAKAMLSINACKGFDIGSGFEGSKMRGSAHNDPFITENGKVRTSSNFSGGTQGGISNGMPIYFRCAFKPVSTIARPQQTVDQRGQETTIDVRGRHDPCVVPRAVPIVEAMAAIVLADHLLRSKTVRLDQLL